MKLIIILIVIVGLGALGYFAYKKHKSKQDLKSITSPSKSEMTAAMVESVTIQSPSTKARVKPLAKIATGFKKVFGRNNSNQSTAVYSVS